jgi:endoglucanase
MHFTHQGARWVQQTAGLSGIRWGTPAEYLKIKSDFDGVKAWADAHHRPIFLGEFGAYDRGDIESRMRYDYGVARAAEAHSFAWAYWQFDSDFVAYDMKTDGWVQPILYALVPPRDAAK